MHSKGHLILLLALWLQPGHLLAQWPDSNRLYAWHNAGFVQQEIRYHQVLFLPNGQPNQASALQQLIDTTPKPLMVLLGAGTYYMQQPITLPDSVVLKGMGNTQTQWVFDGGGKALAALIVQGQLLAGNRLFTQPALRGDTVLYLSNTSQIAAGSLLRLIQQDADLVNDSWAEGRTGQVVQVDSVSGNTVYLHQPLRMHYPLNRQPYARLLQPRRQVGIECLRVERTDNAPDSMGAANLYFSYATQCWVSGVESFKCNRAHIEVNYSAHLQISHNYLHDAFSFGSGGRAYGVALQMATSDVRVENNVFRKLRHAMLLQAGANGNVLAYNYAYESRKAGLLGIITTGEDLVCHGNYPYANLLEANYVQFASIDNAHGKNGPHNTFFRNAVYTTGFRITNPQSDSQTLVGNHRLAGSNSFSGSGHVVLHNSWQGNSAYTQPFLAYTQPPVFLQEAPVPSIGPPAFNAATTIPARQRALEGKPIQAACEAIVWDGYKWQGNLYPSLLTGQYHLWINAGQPCQLNLPVTVQQLTLTGNAELRIVPGGYLTILQ